MRLKLAAKERGTGGTGPKLRDSRHIGDFRGWKNHDAYQTVLARLLRDLRVELA